MIRFFPINLPPSMGGNFWKALKNSSGKVRVCGSAWRWRTIQQFPLNLPNQTKDLLFLNLAHPGYINFASTCPDTTYISGQRPQVPFRQPFYLLSIFPVHKPYFRWTVERLLTQFAHRWKNLRFSCSYISEFRLRTCIFPFYVLCDSPVDNRFCHNEPTCFRFIE